VDPLKHYLRVVTEKTGSLIATSARFGALFASAPQSAIDILTEFGEKIGIAFQLADDVIDIASDSTESGKTPGTDLREGVPTLVTLQILRSNDPKDAALRELLARPMSESEVQSVIKELRTHPALTEAKRYLHTLAAEAKSIIQPLEDNPARRALESLCDAIVDRTA
jgi:heptaprenyl diphosphate synthase